MYDLPITQSRPIDSIAQQINISIVADSGFCPVTIINLPSFFHAAALCSGQQ